MIPGGVRRLLIVSSGREMYIWESIAAEHPSEDSLTITLPPETEQLALRIATRSGKTPENVLREGVEMQAWITGVPVRESTAPPKPDIDRAREIARRISSRPLLDPRTPRDILEQAWAAADDRSR
jgi:hypothetical protein